MKTTTAQLRSPWQTRLIDIDLPDAPGDNEVLLDIDACGICGTDLTVAVTKKEWGPFGHEIAATVRKVGGQVRNVSAGQRVVLESSSFCGVCDLCRSGRVDLCNKGKNFWSQPAMGFSTLMIAPACACVAYEGLSAEVACLAEPAGVAFDLVKTADIRMGDRVAVVGIGPIGLAALALAKYSGAAKLAAFSPAHSHGRIALAQNLGAEVATVERDAPFAEAHRRRFDRVLVTAPVETLPASMDLLDFGGVLAFIGIGAGDPFIRFDANDFHFRKLQLRASHASPAIYYPQVLALLRAGIIPGERLISHRLGLREIQWAMEIARDDKSKAIKIVVAP